MWRRLLTPGWLALHVLALAATAFMVGLGRWQWQRGAALDRLQNYSYAIEWWLFAAFAVFLWVKTMADSLEDRVEEDEPAPVVVVPPPSPDEDDDPELAAYNAHLRALHARSQQDS